LYYDCGVTIYIGCLIVTGVVQSVLY